MSEGKSDANVTQLEIKTETETSESPKKGFVDLFPKGFLTGFDSQGWLKCRKVAAPIIFLSVGLTLVAVGISFWALRDFHRENSAKGVWNKIQLNVQPCDNFYEFACGNWYEHIRNESPFRKKLQQDYYRATEKVLKNVQNGLDVEENARNFFNSCLTAIKNSSSVSGLDDLKSIVMAFEPSQTVELIFREAQDSSGNASMVCTRLTEHYFYFVVTTMQLKYSGGFQPEAMDQKWFKNLREMIENIRSEFVTFLEKSQWLDLESKEEAIEKLQHTKIMIGYEGSNFVKNSHLLDKYHAKEGKMNSTDFVGNMNILFNSSRIKMEQESLFLPEPFITFPSNQNDENEDIEEGSFVIPMGLLQPPFFDPQGSSSINYGSLGTAIAHKLFHTLSFLLNETDPFQCFLEQYSKFKYENGDTFNANFSTEEIIADNGGLQVATRALWRQLVKEQEVKRNSSSSFNDLIHKQNFFVSFAQSWCGHDSYYEEDHEHGIESEMAIHSHLEPKFRVLGALQNSQEFKDVFNCAVDSFMANAKKCSIF